MSEIKVILFPTDLSTDSDEALQHAVRLCQAYAARLVLLHCSEATPAGADENSAKIDTQMRRLFEASLAPYLNVGGPERLRWEGLVRNRVYHLGKAIVSEALKQKADLIVMRALQKARSAVLLGATAQTVCRNAPCSVLILHLSEKENNTC